MSAKFMNRLSDENPDLKKQIGCMNGLFQLFDRHHFLGGSRRIAAPNHKRLLPGSNGKHGTEPKIASQNIKQQEDNLKNTVKEKQRFSFESPRTSFSSSSCSSSYLSVDCSKASQVDRHRPSLTRTSFHETPRQELVNCQSKVFLQSSQHSVDLRDVVKDSIHREARGLLVKTATKVDVGRQQTLKYIDSPRPLQSPKTARTRNTGVNESSHLLTKLQEVPRTANGRTKDGSLTFTPRDAPRFSYDGRRSQDAVKIKLRDQPRLSLDSREISVKGSIDSTRSKFLLGELQRISMNSNDMRCQQQQEPGSYRGPSSVVAKLMGLEALPDPMLTNGNQSFRIKNCRDLKDDSISLSSRSNENKKNQVSCSPRNLKKDPSSPRLTNAVDSKKPVATRCPNEPAPWKQQLDGSRGQTSALKCRETLPKTPNSSLTVYGEIEKRLEDLEFQKSGKDLRALKQILEAMQKSKQMLETRKEDQPSNFISHTNCILGQSSEASNLKKLQSSNTASATVNRSSSPTHLKSPIKIMKPAKLKENGSSSSSSVVATGSLRRLRTSSPLDARNEMVDKQSYKELSPRPNSPSNPSSRLHSRDKNTARTLRLNKSSKELLPIARENPKLAMSSETTCLKLLQKLELEKQSCRTSPASDQSKSRRQSSRLQTESGLPHWKSRHKSQNLQRSDDQKSDISSEMRDLSHQGDASSMQSESNMSAASYGDTEVTSADRSCKIEGTVSQKPEEKHKNSTAEPPRTAMEQPSPVSVLDVTFYGDESPSPVKKKSNAFKDDGLISDEADWSSIGLDHLSSCRENSIRLKTDYMKAENIQQVVRKLMSLDSIHEWSIINEIGPVCGSPRPDHKYIAEILLASGLLSELESNFMACQLHPSGHLINPNLFTALEQTKGSIRLLNRKHNGRKMNQLEPIEKNHRQLIFDAVNEILVRKLVKERSYKPCLEGRRLPKRQQLVRDLCSEIDKLQTASNISLDDEADSSLQSILWGDLTLGSMDWTTECQSKIPFVVLDVERLIFKDLICEVINGEAANPPGQPGSHCRRLFLK